MDRLTLNIPCVLRYRDAAGALIQQICQRLEHRGAATGLTHQVVSAFNEAFNNLVQYAYPPAERGEVEIRLTLEPEQLIIDLLDGGQTFDLDRVETPDLDLLPEAGLGLFIVRSFMTEVSYQPGGDGQRNQLRMTRRLDERRPDPLIQGKTDDA